MPQMVTRSKERTEGARNQSESSIVAVTASVTIRCAGLSGFTQPIENPSKNAIRLQRLKTLLWSVETGVHSLDLTGIGGRCHSSVPKFCNEFTI